MTSNPILTEYAAAYGDWRAYGWTVERYGRAESPAIKSARPSGESIPGRRARARLSVMNLPRARARVAASSLDRTLAAR